MSRISGRWNFNTVDTAKSAIPKKKAVQAAHRHSVFLSRSKNKAGTNTNNRGPANPKMLGLDINKVQGNLHLLAKSALKPEASSIHWEACREICRPPIPWPK